MSDSVVRCRIEPPVKNKANKVLEQMGLTMSEAIRLFLTQVVARKALPFPVEVPNAKTRAAMKAADQSKVEKVTCDELAKEWQDAEYKKSYKPRSPKEISRK